MRWALSASPSERLGDVSASGSLADAAPDSGEDGTISRSGIGLSLPLRSDFLGIFPFESCMLGAGYPPCLFSLLEDFFLFLTPSGFSAGEAGTADCGSGRPDRSV